MKALTHYIFSLGVGCYLVYRFQRRPEALTLVMVVLLAFAANEVIDVFGHVARNGRPARSPWTHSIFTAPAWGAGAALASEYLLGQVLGLTLTAPDILLVAGLGVVVAYTHLLLDALTEGGVFFWRRRIALAHLRYDNLILNWTFSALGLLLLFASFA